MKRDTPTDTEALEDILYELDTVDGSVVAEAVAHALINEGQPLLGKINSLDYVKDPEREKRHKGNERRPGQH